MSLTAALWVLAAAGAAVLAAILFVFARVSRREDEGTRLFADTPVPRRHARPAPDVTFQPVPGVSHDEYAPPPARLDGHARARGGVLTPVLAPAALVAAILRAQAAALMEQRRREDEARFPWLASGQYGEWETGNFTHKDAELVRAALLAEVTP